MHGKFWLSMMFNEAAVEVDMRAFEDLLRLRIF